MALDDNHKPVAIPALLPETQAEERRFEEAQLRREARLRHAAELESLRAG